MLGLKLIHVIKIGPCTLNNRTDLRGNILAIIYPKWIFQPLICFIERTQTIKWIDYSQLQCVVKEEQYNINDISFTAWIISSLEDVAIDIHYIFVVKLHEIVKVETHAH